MPNGASGLDDGSFLADWINQNNASQLATRTQDSITTYYKGQVQDSASWQSASEQFFTNLLGGFGDLGKFLGLVVQAVSGTPGSLADLQQFFTDRWNDLTSAVQGFTNMLEAFGQTTLQGLTDAWNGLVTAAGNATDWVARLINDVLTLLDVFHLSHSKSEWNAAWDDLLTLMGIVHNTAKPALAAPTFGDEITNAKTAASQASSDAAAASTAASTASSAASAASSAAAAATDHVQGVVDGINQALGSGDVTGTSVDLIKQNLANIPQANVAVNRNAGNVQPVGFGSAGAGGHSSQTFSGSSTLTWVHNISGSAPYVLVYVFALEDGNAPPQFTVTANGELLNNLGLVYSQPNYFYVYGGAVKPAAAANVSVVLENQTDHKSLLFGANSVSYSNVAFVSQVVSLMDDSGSTSFAQSLAALAETGALLSCGVASFGAAGADVSTTAVGFGSQRFDSGTTFSNANGSCALSVFDGSPSSAPNFSSTFASGPSLKMGLYVYMEPDMSTVGSTAVLSRASNASMSYGANNKGMPLGFYDTVDVTDDLTAIVNIASPTAEQTKAGCGVQVSLAGTYVISACIGMDTMTGSSLLISNGGGAYPVLYVNGGVVDLGSPVCPVVNNGVYMLGTIGVAHTFVKYLNPGDVVSVGLQYMTNSGWNGAATNVGRPVIQWFSAGNYLKVALANRSLL